MNSESVLTTILGSLETLVAIRTLVLFIDKLTSLVGRILTRLNPVDVLHVRIQQLLVEETLSTLNTPATCAHKC